MKKKMMSLFLSLTMTLSLLVPEMTLPAQAAEGWDGTAATEYAGGSGTRDDPYLIELAAQLALFRDQVNGGHSGICAKVVADIDLNDQSWTPIGLTETGYTGIFDGGGWAVRNMKIDRLSETVECYLPNGIAQRVRAAGLFGVIGTSGVAKYVNVDGSVTGEISSTSDGGVYIGSVAGMSFGSVEECFSTCSFHDLTLSVYNYLGIGGIIGVVQAGGTVKNCYYVGSMRAKLQSTGGSGRNNQYLGGIVGYAMGEVANCYVAVDTAFDSNSIQMYKGTIAGLSYEPEFIVNCYYDNEVTNWTSYVIGGCYKDTGPNGQNSESAGQSSQTTFNMKDWWMPGMLGNAYRYDFDEVNQGYPVLAVMTYGEEAKEDTWYTAELEEYGVTEEELTTLVPTALWNKDLTKNVTRAEFAAVAVNLYELLSGETVAVQIDNPFTDTSNDDIIKAYQLGITNGSSATTFTPYSSISRQDMATMLTRVYKKLYIDGWSLERDGDFRLDYTMPETFLDDERIAGYARDAVYFMSSKGILKGSEGYFYPAAAADTDTVGNATREQAIITSIRYYSVSR